MGNAELSVDPKGVRYTSSTKHDGPKAVSPRRAASTTAPSWKVIGALVSRSADTFSCALARDPGPERFQYGRQP